MAVMDQLPTPDPDDLTLAAARRGDPRALRTLHDSLAAAVLGYARGNGVDDPDALANEALYRGLRDLAGFEGGGRAFRSFVFTIAHNLIVDDHRRRSRRPRTVELDRAPDPTLGATSTDPSGIAVDRVEAARMIRWITELPPDQRSVLLLRLVSDLPIAEVATIVGKRPGAVKALQHRGLAALRRRLDAEGVSRGTPPTFTPVS